MKAFIGTKIVLALAMSRAAFVAYRYPNQKPNPDAGAPDDAGYLVEYTDGGAPNMDGHTGYISWCPKDQFDNANIEIGDIDGLDPFRVRLLGERAQLNANLDKLTAFLSGNQSKLLSYRASGLLERQQYAQQELLSILDQRLDLLAAEAPKLASLQERPAVE